MGGVPLLLMAAVIGITYGWQPNEDGGVDYIIQVPPDQVESVSAKGTINSVIPEHLCGRVTRVIVRVGNHPLPASSKAESHQQRSRSATLTSAQRAPRSLTKRPSNRIAAFKPDPDGQGLGLPATLSGSAGGPPAPALPPNMGGLNDAMTELSTGLAQRARNEIDRAESSAAATVQRGAEAMQRELAERTGQVSSADNLPGQGNSQTATNANDLRPKLPPFTGQTDSGLARVRTGGPTTDEANRRDNRWFEMNANGSRGPSTDPISKTGWPTTTAAESAVQAPATGQQQQPLGSTSTFAHIPKGLDLPASRQQGTNTASTAMTQYERAQYLEQLRQQQQRTDLSGNNGQLTYPTARTTSSLGNERSAVLGNPAARQDLATTRTGMQQPTVDPRLTAEEVARLPFGAYSRDRYGNPIDRDGRILDQYGRVVSQQRAYELTQGRSEIPSESDRSRLSYPSHASSASQVGYQDQLPETARDHVAQQPNYASNPTTRPETAGAISSASDQARSRLGDARVPLQPASPSSNRQTVAAQPIFNVLLLLSIIANFYLIHNLTNLRVRFRDLVATKRAASEISS